MIASTQCDGYIQYCQLKIEIDLIEIPTPEAVFFGS